MIRTRIAPSPTGQDIHVGSIATGLMNYAWAKKHGGQFIIRIEDTDRTRLVPGGEEKMLETMNLIGLIADESPKIGGPHAPYRQSERLEIYKKHAEELIVKGKAYYCICTPERLEEMRKSMQAAKQIPKYDRQCYHQQAEVAKQVQQGAKHVIRMLVPDGDIVFDDLVRGHIIIKSENVDDQVLLKSDGFPTYHLGVVIDDHLMQISHVIRGEEWLPSTPKHILLYQAFGWTPPAFAHVPLLRNPDKSKLSKRKNPVWASDYLSRGILPEALLNYLALMGWSHPEGKDIFSLDEYIKVFDIKDIQKTAPIFDPVKLEWMNGQYLMKLPMTDLQLLISHFYLDKKLPKELVIKTIPLVRERMKKLSDYWPLTQFLFEEPKEYEVDLSRHHDLIPQMIEAAQSVTDWQAEKIGEAMAQTAKNAGVSNGIFFMTLRVAISGKKISPPLNESMELLGKKECIRRLQKI